MERKTSSTKALLYSGRTASPKGKNRVEKCPTVISRKCFFSIFVAKRLELSAIVCTRTLRVVRDETFIFLARKQLGKGGVK